MAKIRIVLWIAGALASLGGLGALWMQTQRLESTQRRLIEVTEERDGLRRAQAEVEAERAAADRRNDISRTTRDNINAVPEIENKPLSQIWRRAFEGADKIGGFE
jgi:hypothetical protein